MALPSILARMLTATVYVASVSARTASGQPTWATPAACSARVEQSTRQIQQTDGAVLQTTHCIFLDTSRPPVRGDRLWLPGDARTDALARIVRHVDTLPAAPGSGTSHYEVYV
jgi:hypothetical protein